MTKHDQRRRPRAFAPDDPALTVSEPVEALGEKEPAHDEDHNETAAASGTSRDEAVGRPTVADLKRGIGWGSVLFSALSGLFILGVGAWFARLASAALARDDFVGWIAYGLLIIAAVAADVLTVRELIGY